MGNPYILALRPWSFPAALVPILLTIAIVHRSGEEWNKLEALRAVLLGVLVQAAANVNNTYWDFVNGVDTPTVGGGADPSVVMPHKAVLVDGSTKPRPILLLGVSLYGLSTVLVLDRLVAGGTMLFVYVAGMGLAFFYTAPPLKLKYFALGDIAIFIAFGPLLCYCTLLLLNPLAADKLRNEVLVNTSPCAFICECILHANNSRDIGEDRKAGLITVATVLGYEKARLLYMALISGAYVTVILGGLVRARWGVFLVVLSIPLARKVIGRFCRDINIMADLPKQTAKLHMAFGLLLILGTLIS